MSASAQAKFPADDDATRVSINAGDGSFEDPERRTVLQASERILILELREQMNAVESEGYDGRAHQEGFECPEAIVELVR